MAEDYKDSDGAQDSVRPEGKMTLEDDLQPTNCSQLEQFNESSRLKNISRRRLHRTIAGLTTLPAAYLLGSLSLDDAKTYRQHVQDCLKCEQRLDDLIGDVLPLFDGISSQLEDDIVQAYGVILYYAPHRTLTLASLEQSCLRLHDDLMVFHEHRRALGGILHPQLPIVLYLCDPLKTYRIIESNGYCTVLPSWPSMGPKRFAQAYSTTVTLTDPGVSWLGRSKVLSDITSFLGRETIDRYLIEFSQLE